MAGKSTPTNNKSKSGFKPQPGFKPQQGKPQTSGQNEFGNKPFDPTNPQYKGQSGKPGQPGGQQNWQGKKNVA